MKILTTLHNEPGTGIESWKFVTLALCMMTGTASLPHILMRYFTTPTVRAARQSVAWSLLFIFLLYFTSPALATLTKLQIMDPNLATGIIGKSFEEVSALTWIQKWSGVGCWRSETAMRMVSCKSTSSLCGPTSSCWQLRKLQACLM